LLHHGRGFPLFFPGPQANLSLEYRARGVAIGDVGLFNPDGRFDFFFNIFLGADHAINANVPGDFDPLPLYDPVDVATDDINPGDHVSSPSVTGIRRGISE
jgi:hypothetical protein